MSYPKYFTLSSISLVFAVGAGYGFHQDAIVAPLLLLGFSMFILYIVLHEAYAAGREENFNRSSRIRKIKKL